MIVEVDRSNFELINKLENAFSTVFSYKDYILNDFKNNIFSKYFIYFDKSNIIGFVNYYEIYDKIEIANIYVDEMNRSKKVGSKMIEYLINLAKQKNVENITLEVNINNVVARKLYEKYGFKSVAIRQNYYNGIDGILMERKMK